MQNRFKYHFAVPYEGVRPDLTLSFGQLMTMLQETAIAHSASTKLPFSWFTENNIGFLLTNWDVSVFSHPSLYENITAYTWPVFFKGISASRSFLFLDNNEKKLATANSRWAFVDLSLGRPVKIPENVIAAYGECFPAVSKPDFSFPEVSSFTKINEITFKAAISDIDSNYHANNIKYVEWAINATPPDIYYTKRVVKMKTQYKKPVVLGDLVDVYTFSNEPENNEMFYSIKVNGTDYAAVYFVWSD